MEFQKLTGAGLSLSGDGGGGGLEQALAIHTKTNNAGRIQSFLIVNPLLKTAAAPLDELFL
jgi:hypothetical protein